MKHNCSICNKRIPKQYQEAHKKFHKYPKIKWATEVQRHTFHSVTH